MFLLAKHLRNIQKGQRLRLVPLIQRESILHMTDIIRVTSFWQIFTRYLRLHRWNTSTMLEYVLRYQ
jgi:hypothetical protein